MWCTSIIIMSQNPNKRNKDTKEVAEENIDQQIDNEDPAGGEEVAGQRDAKSADVTDSANSVIV
jgi:hypothetical protein